MGRDLEILVPSQNKGNYGRTILFVQRNYALFEDLMQYSENDGKIITETIDLELPLHFGKDIFSNSYGDPIVAIKARLLLKKMKDHDQEQYGGSPVMAYLQKLGPKKYVYLNFV